MRGVATRAAICAACTALCGPVRGAESPGLSHELARGWSYGGAFEVDSITERRFDLDSGDDDVVALEPRVELAVAYEPERGPRFYAEGRLSKGVFLSGGGTRDAETAAELRQAHLSIDGPRPGLSFHVGRQRFEDERGWWYDEDLDAVRVLYETGPAALEFSVSRNPGVGADVLGRERAGRADNVMAVGSYALDEATEISAYLIAQDNRSEPAEKPFFLGLRAIGAGIGDRFDYYIDAALVGGTDDDRNIRAYGFDAGIAYDLDVRHQPSLLLAIAFGSGDDDPLDGTDSEFRQTGMQSSFFDYGEVLAPELSNMWVATAGMEVSPSSDWSIRGVYHRYRQHHAAASLRDTLIERDPDGISRDLGQEFDIIATYEGIDDLYLDLVVGVFDPGDAFGPGTDRAWFGQVTMTYEFW